MLPRAARPAATESLQSSTRRNRRFFARWATTALFPFALASICDAGTAGGATGPGSVPFAAADVLAVDSAIDARIDPRADLLSLAARLEGGRLVVRVGLTGGPKITFSDFQHAGHVLRLSVADAAGLPVYSAALASAHIPADRPLDLATATRQTPADQAPSGDKMAAVLKLPAEPALLTAAQRADARAPLTVTVRIETSAAAGQAADVLDEISGVFPARKLNEAHCAFAHHGNQGLAYTDVFQGRSDDLAGSGFDEALEVHQATGIPGNFHVSGTLITSAEWDANNGNPVDFNAWLASGVQAGWAAMLTSAYAQHIMPFAYDAMNNWSVNTQADMVAYRYGYTPRTAWVPERVWLDPSRFPAAGVNDWPGDNFLPHGVWAVILDDDVHLTGYDNHQIHTLTNGLRVVPRDRTFTGRVVGGNGQGALDLLTGLANSGVGEFRIAVYAEDWEAVAEMGFWSGATPQAKETYDWLINRIDSEPWVHTWRIDDALNNPNFNGATIAQLTPGTYSEIGGLGGYGGGNNGWYTHWAGWVPYVTGGNGFGSCSGTGGNCRNYGAMWTAAANKLLTVPNNDISESGWYVLMTNLHETAWHDGLGGAISGWQHGYSAKTKNALVYAEAARWAGGLYGAPTGAYTADLDEDGFDEVVLYNERVFAFFEAAGGRAVNVFAKGSGYDFSAVGVDNAYWYGTEADYNDGNHVGAFSDVGPNTQHDSYSWSIDAASGSTVGVTFRHGGGLEKSFSLDSGQPFVRCVYRTGAQTTYIQTGMSPGLVDLIWNAQMDRVWTGDQAYMGRRNPNTGATVAYVLGQGGAAHQKEIAAQIMKGDEIRGVGAFEFYLFAGQTPAPVAGELAELRTLATGLVDALGPRPESAVYLPGTDRLRVTFDQAAVPATLVPAGFAIDDDGDSIPELTLSPATSVTETSPASTLSLELTAGDATALEGLNLESLRLIVAAASVEDVPGNPGLARTVDLDFGAATAITLDGHLEAAEWQGPCTLAWVDPPGDSAWTATNELDAVFARWDASYLYLAIDGTVSGNSWVLYLDTDPGGPAGQSNLTAIDAWERGATFVQPGIKPDFQYGAYQHQSAFDSDSFFRITSATTTVNLTSQVLSAIDPQHVYGGSGGSELAIPWDVLYGLGAGVVPAGAQIRFAVSICWDPEPAGVLGGDNLPNNVAATLPAIDGHATFTVDADADGAPDLPDVAGPTLQRAQLLATGGVPYQLMVEFDEPLDAASATNLANYTIYETALPSNTIEVTAAASGPVPGSVVLEVDGYPWHNAFTLQVSNVRDLSCNGNMMSPNQSTVIEDQVSAAPPGGQTGRLARAQLHPNVPNPFNPATQLRFFVPASQAAAPVHLSVHDLRGRQVARLLSGAAVGAGEHSVPWDGQDDSGRPVASGQYIVRLEIDREVLARKITLAK